MKNRLLLALRIFLITLIIGTLSFTFYQSSLPPEESTEVSENVSDKLEPIIPSDTPTGEFVHTNIRKIAHFVEFAVLGFAVALYVVIFMPKVDSQPVKRLRFMIYAYVLAPIVALFDETIQIFTERGPAIADVWIDVSGYASSSTAVYLIYFVAILVLRYKRAALDNQHTDGE